MILWFDEIGKDDISKVGGKGANLGEMTRAGFPVPPGFCITTEAYREHISGLNLEQQACRLVSADAHTVEETAEKICRMIEDKPIAAGTAGLIRTAYEKLAGQGEVYVAVRSSATAEDLKEASFAGQQETFLYVGGVKDLLTYVKKCWASLWTPRSIAYRQRIGFDNKPVYMSVVVQVMVRSEKSGVLFTVNPLTGNSGEMLLNAAYGLGESIVSGRVTPDSWRISKKTGSPPAGRISESYPVAESMLGSKHIRTVAAPDGLTIDEPVPDSLRNCYCLDIKEIKELLLLGEKVEQHYHGPQDIEWAIREGRLYLLQVRPVTAGAGASRGNYKNGAGLDGKVSGFDTSKAATVIPARNSSDKAVQKLLDNFKEHIPDPPFPMDYEPLLLLNEQKNAVIRELGITMPPVEKIIRMDDHGVLSIGSLKPRPNIRILCLPLSLRRLMTRASSEDAGFTVKKLDAKYAELSRMPVKTLENNELALHIGRLTELSMQYIRLRFSAFVFPMILLGIRLKLLARLSAGQRKISQYDFLADLDYKTAEIESALYTLAEYAFSISALRSLFSITGPDIMDMLRQTTVGRSFIEMLDEFLRIHGARSSKAYMPFSTESWGERPELLLNTLSALIKAGNVGYYSEKQKSAKEKYKTLVKGTAEGLPGFLRKRFNHTLELFRKAHVGREALLYRMEECFTLLRAAAGEAAIRLEQGGMLRETGDMRFLLLSELQQSLCGESGSKAVLDKIEDRKAHRSEAEAAWNGKNRGTASPGTGDSLKTGVLLKGMPGSPGLAEGTVKIINNPGEFFKLQSGNVLVCRFTDPSWTPLFSVACGIVCDTGGPLSHAAIVAREYGIPAVLGTGNATSVLKNGDIVRIDGSSGTVTSKAG